MYPDERVARFITESFVPVRVNVREQSEAFKRLGERYGAQWTPALLVLNEKGEEEYRIEGYLPAEQLMARLALGLGRHAYLHERYDDAEHHFRAVVDRHPGDEAAAEAMYWAGVARYKGTKNAGALAETAAALTSSHGDSIWATKASVWKH